MKDDIAFPGGMIIVFAFDADRFATTLDDIVSDGDEGRSDTFFAEWANDMLLIVHERIEEDR